MIIILEKGNNSLKNYDDDNTDYTSEVGKDGLSGEGEEENNETVDSDTDTDDNEDFEESTDYTSATDISETADEDETEATDYTGDVEDGDGAGDDGNTDESDAGGQEEDSYQENTDENEQDKKLNTELLDDFITLHNSIKVSRERLGSMEGNDITLISVLQQVSKNLSNLEKFVFDYILTFKNYSYIQNLYRYNYFLEAFKLNVQMIEKVKSIKIQ